MKEGQATKRSGKDALLRAFHFDADEAHWFQQLRGYSAEPGLGRIGDYELLDEAGRGGQGIVFKARQPRTGREIAIKRLSAGAFATPDMRARFDREIEAAVALDHANIVTVFGTEIVDGQQLLAMKWIDGVPIDRWARPLHEPPRSIREILEIFTVVCDAVHHAHQRGVIHRDLKPSNVLVDKENRPFVLDFGLAKVARDTAAAASITMTGDFLGTPAYAAPEQLRGDMRAIDVRTDVYSLGAILYRLLTGVSPFDVAGDLPALIQNVLGRDPPRPSSHDAELNREIDAILLKALAKEKGRRYASIDALADDVRRFLSGQAVFAHPPSTVYQLRKFVRQYRAGVAISVAFAVLLVAATVVSTSFFFQSDRDRRRADAALDSERKQLAESQRQKDRAEKEASKATSATQFVTQMLVRANRAEQKGNPNVTVREALDAAAAELDEGKSPMEPEVEASVRLTIANTYEALSLVEAAEPHFLKALELSQAAFGEKDLRVAEIMHQLAKHNRPLGKVAEAEKLLTSALRIREELIPDHNDPLIAETYVGLAITKRYQGKFEDAESLYLRAIDAFRQSLGPDHVNIGINTRSLGILYICMGRIDDAEKMLRNVLDFFLRIRSEPDGDITATREALASVISKRGDPDGEAEEYFRQTLQAKAQLHGPDSPALAIVQTSLAALLYGKDRNDEAAELVTQAVYSIEPARLMDALDWFTKIVYTRQNRVTDTETVMRQVIERREAYLGHKHPALVHARRYLGEALTVQQRFAEAEPILISVGNDVLDNPDSALQRKQEAIRLVISLYESWGAAEPGKGYADKAAAWQERMVEPK